MAKKTAWFLAYPPANPRAGASNLPGVAAQPKSSRARIAHVRERPKIFKVENFSIWSERRRGPSERGSRNFFGWLSKSAKNFLIRAVWTLNLPFQYWIYPFPSQGCNLSGNYSPHFGSATFQYWNGVGNFLICPYSKMFLTLKAWGVILTKSWKA